MGEGGKGRNCRAGFCLAFLAHLASLNFTLTHFRLAACSSGNGPKLSPLHQKVRYFCPLIVSLFRFILFEFEMQLEKHMSGVRQRMTKQLYLHSPTPPYHLLGDKAHGEKES